MNYLISGGNGFIGKNLIITLIKNKKNKIYVIDSNKKKLIKKHNLKYIHSKISSKSLQKIKNIKFDYIYHFAALLGVSKVISFPYKVVSENIRATQEIIDFAKSQKNLKRFFFASTSEIYSHGSKLFSETEKIFCPQLDHPRTSYWISKLTGEFLVNISGLPYTNFRIFNAYGPFMKKTHVIPEAFFKLTNNKFSFHNPNHVRSFIFMNDLIKMMLISRKKSFKNRSINIGNPSEPIQIKRLIFLISKILKIDLKKINFYSANNNSIKYRKPNISLFLKLANLKTIKFTKLCIGLDKYYKFIKKNEKKIDKN